ncbi:Nop53 (60S ribosomal biogenesis) [Nakaseomyces glabratus]|nr:Nop53 (60S ribosomal biogenesis) [Nakaseomyces glabratus]KAH7580009.1 Nop53 (60S ribosomal biogenesis) [Nakaseomyces glabratus]KTB15400.1 Ribosome biogenesis protein NOP53 [Nakaseomyces glabratus]KTB16670.1 Ribosome biogenesis protein NOP53 [Nakaseomyces glabratus]
MAPLKVNERPAQYKQSSRKGKKAWRKNIDLTDIEKSIETQKDLEITHGTSDLASLQDTALFQVDEEGDIDLKKALIKRKQIKKNLKSKEILDSIKTASKIKSVIHPRHQEHQTKEGGKVQGVSKKELKKLLSLAGKIQGESKLKNRSDKDGLVKSAAADLWNEEESHKVKLPSGIEFKKKRDEIPEELIKYSTTSWSIAEVKPKTLEHKPVKVAEYEDLPHAGKSYNPDSKHWNSLISKEYESEKKREDARNKIQEYQAKIQRLMEVLDDKEEESSSEEDEEDEEDETEENTESADVTLGLSINPVVKNKKKTKYQKNKAKRHEEKVKMHKEIKELKQQIKELEKIEEIEQEVEKRHEEKDKKVKKEKKNKKGKLGTKYHILNEGLEVKFKDELSDSLRKVRPEGSLLYDTVRKLQSSGKVEARIPRTKGRRYKQKITEKWTYKDFK